MKRVLSLFCVVFLLLMANLPAHASVGYNHGESGTNGNNWGSVENNAPVTDIFFSEFGDEIVKLWNEVDGRPVGLKTEVLDSGMCLYYLTGLSNMPLGVQHANMTGQSEGITEAIGIFGKGTGDEDDLTLFLHGALTAVYLSDPDVKDIDSCKTVLENVVKDGSYTSGNVSYMYYINNQGGTSDLYSSEYQFLVQIHDEADTFSENISRTLVVGDTVTFGSYEQDNNTANGKEPIEWLLLDVQNEKMLLIAQYGLDAEPYNKEWEDATWENCSLRTWLNDIFLNGAFNSEERTHILISHIDNSKSQARGEWVRDGGNDTDDRIFLLSNAEVDQYFDRDRDKVCKPTAYAKEQKGAFTFDDDGECIWWLRSPEEGEGNAATIGSHGSIGSTVVDYDSVVVRPSIWVELNDEFLSGDSSVAQSDMIPTEDTQTVSKDEVKPQGSNTTVFWNVPFSVADGYTACFYDDGDGYYRFEVTNPDVSSTVIYYLLENCEFQDYGIGFSMFHWMNHIYEDCRSSEVQGNMSHFVLSGTGGYNEFYFCNNYSDDGLVGLKLSSQSSMEAMFEGTINSR